MNVHQLHFMLEVCHTVRCVGGLRDTSLDATFAFLQYLQGIDGQYVDGVSLTHGRSGSHEHIWTFAAGLAESEEQIP